MAVAVSHLCNSKQTYVSHLNNVSRQSLHRC